MNPYDTIGDAEDCQTEEVSPGVDGCVSRTLTIVNKKGLHARATAKFVQLVETLDCEVTVTRCGETVGGTSIMGILTLGAGIGTTITVTARGPGAEKGLDAIGALVASRFGEDG